MTINQLKKLNKEAFKVSFKRKRTLNNNLRVVEIKAFFEDCGSYSKMFAFDEVEGVLYEAKYIIDDNNKLQYEAILDGIKIKNLDELCNIFKLSMSNVTYKFETLKKAS